MDYRIIYLLCFGWKCWLAVSALQAEDHGYYPPVVAAGYKGSVAVNSSTGQADEQYEEDDHEPETYVPYQQPPPQLPYPAVNGSAAPVKGQPYAHPAHRAQNYARNVDPNVKSAPYMPSQYNRSAIPDQHYGQPYAGQYSRYKSDTNYAANIDPTVQNAYYTPPYSALAPYQTNTNYAVKAPPYSPQYTATPQYAVQDKGPSYHPTPIISNSVQDQHYGQPAVPPVGPSFRPVTVINATVQEQHYGQPYTVSYQTYKTTTTNYAPPYQPAVKAPPYSQPYSAAPQYYPPAAGLSFRPTPIINNSIVHEQHYGQPAVPPVGPSYRPVPVISSSVQEQHYGQSYSGNGYRPYSANARSYIRPAATGVPYQAYPATSDYAYKSDALCTISETPVDKSLYCGIPNLKILLGQPIDPVKVAGEWYLYRHSPVDPALINRVLHVRVFGEATELPATSFTGVGVWAVLSGFRSTTDSVCTNQFYVGFISHRGTQVVDTYRPERARIEPSVYHTLYLNERRGVWLNYECARYNALTGVCAVPNLYLNVRERPDLMSRDDQNAVDTAINQVLAEFCMNVDQMPKQIFTNHKGTCAVPKIPEWLNMKIQGIVAYNRKTDHS